MFATKRAERLSQTSLCQFLVFVFFFLFPPLSSCRPVCLSGPRSLNPFASLSVWRRSLRSMVALCSGVCRCLSRERVGRWVGLYLTSQACPPPAPPHPQIQPSHCGFVSRLEKHCEILLYQVTLSFLFCFFFFSGDLIVFYHILCCVEIFVKKNKPFFCFASVICLFPTFATAVCGSVAFSRSLGTPGCCAVCESHKKKGPSSFSHVCATLMPQLKTTINWALNIFFFTLLCKLKIKKKSFEETTGRHWMKCEALPKPDLFFFF